jgi:triosephosphate isomerase
MSSISFQPASAQNLTEDGQTITLPAQQASQLLTTTGAYTGIVLAEGVADGQLLILINASANSITFAASGTSYVADGASCVIAANTAMLFQWSLTNSLWYHT